MEDNKRLKIILIAILVVEILNFATSLVFRFIG